MRFDDRRPLNQQPAKKLPLRHPLLGAACVAASLAFGLLAGLSGLSVPAHAENLKQVYSKSNVDDELSLKVLKTVSARMHESFAASCGSSAAHTGTWNVACNGTYPYGGTITYACISGIAAIQSQSCK